MVYTRDDYIVLYNERPQPNGRRLNWLDRVFLFLGLRV